MVERHISCLDLDQIAASGQCFTWQRLGEGHYGIPARGSYVEAEQRGERLVFSCGETEFEALWADYFDLSTDYEAIQAAIDPADGYLRAAARYGRGIRVLRQDLWEVLVSFLISQNNNIPRITAITGRLCEGLGEKLDLLELPLPRRPGRGLGVRFCRPGAGLPGPVPGPPDGGGGGGRL